MVKIKEWAQGLQNAIDYIENHLTEKIDYEEVARSAFYSSYHFQRIFGIFFGITLGEYIRKRRLTLAGLELSEKKCKITDIALKYGYDTPESFSRAFASFHGINPSQVVKGTPLNSYSRLKINFNIEGGGEMKYKISKMPEIVLVGYKKHFSGVPYGEDRSKQENEFYSSTRAKQWLLIGASCDYENEYCVITNVCDDGYYFYIAYKLDEWTREQLFNPKVTGIDFIDKFGYEKIVVPESMYAVFETERKQYPIDDYSDIRRKIITDWLPSTNYMISQSPEMVVMHWRTEDRKKKRYIEVCLPVSQK